MLFNRRSYGCCFGTAGLDGRVLALLPGIKHPSVSLILSSMSSSVKTLGGGTNPRPLANPESVPHLISTFFTIVWLGEKLAYGAPYNDSLKDV